MNIDANKIIKIYQDKLAIETYNLAIATVQIEELQKELKALKGDDK